MEGQYPASDFDAWAAHYDVSVLDGRYPFTGYADTILRIVNLVDPHPGVRVLDLGTGTGNLALPFARSGCSLWCTDFSTAMLERARSKLPQARFVLHDLRCPLPEECNGPFDAIVSAYVFHHFPLEQKVHILGGLRARLAPQARIVIGDIAFPDAASLGTVRAAVGEDWEEEFYWLADQAVPALEKAGFKVEYEQVSNCAGTLSLRKVI
jgi:putative AdoMet-dependent methyltransferase